MYLPDLNESKDVYINNCISYLTEEDGLTSIQANVLCSACWEHSRNESQQIIDINSTYQIINEAVSTAIVATKLAKVLGKNSKNKSSTSSDKKNDIKNDIGSFSAMLIGSDGQSQKNKLFPKPKGIIITDTFNHPVFPISFPRIDTSKFNLPEVSARFHEDYTGMKLDYLPWHFTIEFIRSQYYVFNTRPIDMKFPLTTLNCEKIIDMNDVKLNDRTQNFITTKPFNLNEAIHIAIIGDSYKDVYTQRLYEIIGRNCIGPILRYFKLSSSMWTKVWSLNMGSKFKSSILEHYLKR